MKTMIFELLKALLYGIVEGITEWLPISSTGHLILLNQFISLNVSAAFLEMFEVVIQLGAILAVVILFFHKLNPFSPSKTRVQKRDTWDLWFHVIIAVIPSAVAGLFLDDWFNDHLFNYITVSIALIVYGIIFMVIENGGKGRLVKFGTTSDVTYLIAFAIGLFQMLSLVPGTSRSGSTILGAMLIGASRTVAAEFSFFMAIPTMLGASLLKAAKFILEGNAMTSQEILILFVGCLTAFLVSMVTIKGLMEYVKRHSFSAFGVYRIALGLVVIIFYMCVA